MTAANNRDAGASIQVLWLRAGLLASTGRDQGELVQPHRQRRIDRLETELLVEHLGPRVARVQVDPRGLAHERCDRASHQLAPEPFALPRGAHIDVVHQPRGALVLEHDEPAVHEVCRVRPVRLEPPEPEHRLESGLVVVLREQSDGVPLVGLRKRLGHMVVGRRPVECEAPHRGRVVPAYVPPHVCREDRPSLPRRREELHEALSGPGHIVGAARDEHALPPVALGHDPGGVAIIRVEPPGLPGPEVDAHPHHVVRARQLWFRLPVIEQRLVEREVVGRGDRAGPRHGRLDGALHPPAEAWERPPEQALAVVLDQYPGVAARDELVAQGPRGPVREPQVPRGRSQEASGHTLPQL